jgi:4'-phosphopantetheinyl transferase
MNVYWLEQAETDVTSDDLWLSDSEALCLSGFRFPKRRADWRLGRWTAKRAVATYLNVLPHPHLLARIEIRPAPSGAPEVFFDNQTANVTISLSHSSSRALAAVAQSNVRLGCDLEVIEARSNAFIIDYFTPEEQALVARTSGADKARVSTLLWSAKESALKALQEGLRLDTRSVNVRLDATLPHRNGWNRLKVCHVSGQAFHGWWRQEGGVLRTLVADPSPFLPISLDVSAPLWQPPPGGGNAMSVNNRDHHFQEHAFWNTSWGEKMLYGLVRKGK